MNIINEAKTLRAIRFGAGEPFLLMLDESTSIKVDAILRLIPGRRMVVVGTWQNKRIVAKLFFDKKHAERHFATEKTGIKLLQERNIPSPTVYCESKSADKQIYALVFEYLHADIDLTAAWSQHNLREELLPLLKMLVVEVATQHVFGLVQRDLHLNNFVFAKNVIYTLDGAQIESHGAILPKKESMHNLALLFSQLGVGADHYQEILFKQYVNARGWVCKDEELQELFFMIDLWGRERWNNFSRKIFRESTHFKRISGWNSEAVCERSYCQPELLQFINHPEAVFARSDITMLKNGRSSTVIGVKLDGRNLVIKRYNMKNLWHWLRRCLRTTRAKKCWRIAQKLKLFGIHTAPPVAYVENRALKFHGKSYFVTECVAGKNVSDYLQSQADASKQNNVINQVCVLLAQLKKTAITHGDLKATNLLVNDNDEPVLIDLDGTREHSSVNTLQRISNKEWQRFLQNFDAMPILKEEFSRVQRTHPGYIGT